MKNLLVIFILCAVVFSTVSAESDRGYIPFVYGTYDQGDRIRIQFDRDKKINNIDFTWSDESEDKNTRVELYVDHMYKGSKRVWSSWGNFWVNAAPRFRVELRVARGKIKIRRGYISYSYRDTESDEQQYLDLMISKGVEASKALELFNCMDLEEQMIVLPAVMAINSDDKQAVAVLQDKYEELIRTSETVNIFNELFGTRLSEREYVFASGHYYNGSTVWLNVQKNRKIRSVSVNWRTKDQDNTSFSNVRGELYVDGIYQGSKYIRSYSYDTFYLWNKEVNFNMQFRIRGGEVYISSVYVTYAD